jgi:spermidine/putrescine transport system permease protein
MIGMVYDFLPYMILPIFNAISDIDTDTIEAAKDLGAGSLAVFWKIIFPLSMPGMLSGIVMVFVPSMTSFVIADILGGGKLQLIGNIIEQEFMKSMDWHLGAGLSISLMLLVLVSLAFTMKNDRKEKRTILW